MDAQVGKVLAELDRSGLRDNTIVVIWSDHGFHLGEHGLWAKTSNFELDARVPLMIAVPEQRLNHQAAGQRTNSLTELLDIYPTLADLCDLDPPDNLAGKSLKPILIDPSAKVKEAALTQHPRPAYPEPNKTPDAMGYSIRTERYRYTQWREFDSGDLIAEELYDHDRDPDENINIAENSGPIVKSLLPLIGSIVDHEELLRQ